MAVLFNITVPSNTLTLDAKRSGQITFTVASTSGRSLVALAQLSPSDPSMASWFQLEQGAARRSFESHQTVQYVVTVQAPPTAPAQDYTFHLIIAEESNPDDNFSNSPDIKVTVPAPNAPPPKKPFPWWIVAVAAAILIMIVAIIVIAVNNSNQANANATSTARANFNTQTAVFLSDQSATQTAEFLVQQGQTQAAAAALAQQGQTQAAALLTQQAAQVFASQTAAAVFATQTQQARPTATLTPRPPATITVSNSGGFFAFFSVSYNTPGGFQSQSTSQFGAGSSQSITVPGDATGISVQIQVNTGFGNRNACGAINLDSAQDRSFNVSGTTFNSSCN